MSRPLCLSVQVYHAFYKPLEFTVAERDASQCYIKVGLYCLVNLLYNRCLSRFFLADYTLDNVVLCTVCSSKRHISRIRLEGILLLLKDTLTETEKYNSLI